MSRFTDIINEYRAATTRGDQHESMVDLAESVDGFAEELVALWESAEDYILDEDASFTGCDDAGCTHMDCRLYRRVQALRPLFGDVDG